MTTMEHFGLLLTLLIVGLIVFMAAVGEERPRLRERRKGLKLR